MKDKERIPIVGANGIDSFRESGYKNTAYAIAELVDNSIQANANKIDIVLVQNSSDRRIHEILVFDDGEGMDYLTFSHALIFAAGTRLRNKSGLGRYGMGLPNSSVSQTKRFEVFTWQPHEKNTCYLYNYMDLEEIKNSNSPFLNFPEKVDSLKNEKLLSLSKIIDSSSGTVVLWRNPDRLRWKTANTLCKHLYKYLGRIFRYYINGFNLNGSRIESEINIRVFDYNGHEYSELQLLSKTINAFDPLFVMPNTQTIETFIDKKSNGVTSKLWNKTTKNFKDEDGNNHKVILKFSKLDKKVRDKLEIRNIGSTDLGLLYLYRNLEKNKPYSNIAIVRSHREIDAGQYGFVNDISDPRNRFWSVEILIESISDELFGIDNSKQSAQKFSNFSLEDDIVDEEDFTSNVMSQISTIINLNISLMMKELAMDGSQKRRDGSDDPEPEIDIPFDPIPLEGTETDDGQDADSDENRAEIKKWLLHRYSENYRNNRDLLERTIEWVIKLPSKHYIIYSNLGDIELYYYKILNDKILIEINVNHPFYDKFIRDIEEKNDENSINIIWFLFSALVETETKFVNTPDERILKKIRANVASNLTDLIENWFSR